MFRFLTSALVVVAFAAPYVCAALGLDGTAAPTTAVVATALLVLPIGLAADVVRARRAGRPTGSLLRPPRHGEPAARGG